MKHFTYEPIDLDYPSFRLVRLFRGDQGSVQCELFHAQIHDAEDALEYEALSYTWGGQSKPCSIDINGRPFSVTESLFRALLYLRDEQVDRILWIDAICIDQENDIERGHQVRRMALIYKNARQVVIWLGLPTPETDLVFESMQHLEQLALDHACNDWRPADQRWHFLWSTVELSLKKMSGDHTIRQCEGFMMLLNRSWFKRIWVLQEVAKARSAKIVCGTMSVSARIFAITPPLLGIKPDFHSQAVLDIMPGPSRKHSWWFKNRDLYTLLSRFQASQATDERDLVYALLGISSDASDTSSLLPDYSKAVEDVVQDTVAFLFDSHNSKGFVPFENIPRWSMRDFQANLESLHDDLQHLRMEPTRLLVELRALGEIDPGCTDFDIKDPYKRTPLMRAARNGHPRLVQALLDTGSTYINSQDWLGQTSLSLSAEEGHVEIVKMLLEDQRIIVDSKDWRGRTSLSWAAGRGHTAIVYALLASGRIGDIDAKDKSGWTALSLAIENSHAAVVEALTTYGTVIHS